MKIYAEIVADSISEQGVRLTTVECRYPRFILPEVNTHRVFSRNGASSRAIPYTKMVKAVLDDPARPMRWLQNQPGMTAAGEFNSDTSAKCDEIWERAMLSAMQFAGELAEIGVAKQYVNRLIEPFMMTRTLITSSKWANFFKLRDHATAMPEFATLAVQIREAMDASVPISRSAYHDDVARWHLPFISEVERYGADLLTKVKVIPQSVIDGFKAVPFEMPGELPLLIMSAARCARVSVCLFDGTEPSFESDLNTFTKLWSDPLHASPMEHQGLPLTPIYSDRAGNFHGWAQFRKFLPNEQALDAVYTRS